MEGTGNKQIKNNVSCWSYCTGECCKEVNWEETKGARGETLGGMLWVASRGSDDSSVHPEAPGLDTPPLGPVNVGAPLGTPWAFFSV